MRARRSFIFVLALTLTLALSAVALADSAYLPLALREHVPGSTPPATPGTTRTPTARPTLTPTASSTPTATGTTSTTPSPSITPTLTPTQIVLQHDNGAGEWLWTEARQGSEAGVIYSLSSPLSLQTVQAVFDFSGDRLIAQAHVYRVEATSPELRLRLLGTSEQVAYPAPGNMFIGTATIDFRFGVPVEADGQIMLAIEYLAGESGATPPLNLDSQTGIPPGIVWLRPPGAEAWQEHYDFWDEPEQIGYPMIRGYGERGATPGPTATPTTTHTATPTATATATRTATATSTPTRASVLLRLDDESWGAVRCWEHGVGQQEALVFDVPGVIEADYVEMFGDPGPSWSTSWWFYGRAHIFQVKSLTPSLDLSLLYSTAEMSIGSSMGEPSAAFPISPTLHISGTVLVAVENREEPWIGHFPCWVYDGQSNIPLNTHWSKETESADWVEHYDRFPDGASVGYPKIRIHGWQ